MATYNIKDFKGNRLATFKYLRYSSRGLETVADFLRKNKGRSDLVIEIWNNYSSHNMYVSDFVYKK